MEDRLENIETNLEKDEEDRRGEAWSLVRKKKRADMPELEETTGRKTGKSKAKNLNAIIIKSLVKDVKRGNINPLKAADWIKKSAGDRELESCKEEL